MALKPLDKTATRMFTLAIQVEDIKAEQNKPQSEKGRDGTFIFFKVYILNLCSGLSNSPLSVTGF